MELDKTRPLLKNCFFTLWFIILLYGYFKCPDRADVLRNRPDTYSIKSVIESALDWFKVYTCLPLSHFSSFYVLQRTCDHQHKIILRFIVQSIQFLCTVVGWNFFITYKFRCAQRFISSLLSFRMQLPVIINIFRVFITSCYSWVIQTIKIPHFIMKLEISTRHLKQIILR